MATEDHGHNREVENIDQIGLGQKIEDPSATFAVEVPPSLGFGEGQEAGARVGGLIFRCLVPDDTSSLCPSLLSWREEKMQQPGRGGKERMIRGERTTSSDHDPCRKFRSPGHQPLVPPFAGGAESEGHAIRLQGRLPDQHGVGLRAQGEQPPVIFRRTKAGAAPTAGGNFPIGGKGEVGGDPESHAIV